MKRKMKRAWDTLRNRIESTFSFQKNKKSNGISIPVAGVKKNDVEVHQDDGLILIESTQAIVVEESSRYRPSKCYNSFGFNRTIYLPDGVEVSKTEMDIYPDEVRISW